MVVKSRMEWISENGESKQTRDLLEWKLCVLAVVNRLIGIMLIFKIIHKLTL